MKANFLFGIEKKKNIEFVEVTNEIEEEVPIKYDSKYKNLEPTHISIVMTSSRQGDLFIGAEGSTLTVDNVVVNY